MDTSLLRKQRSQLGHYASHIFPVLVALTAGSGMLKAANLLQTYASNGSTVITSVTLTCNTATGPGASATIIVKPLTALVSPNQILVEATAGSATGTVNGLTGGGAANVVITAPGAHTLTSAITSLTYTVSLAATPSVGCNGLTVAAPTFFFDHIAGTTTVPGSVYVADVPMTVNTTPTQTVSGLTVSLATINLTCQLSGSTYYPSAAQTVSVGSTASTGNVFALNTAGSLPAAWVTLADSSPGGTATSGTPITFTVQAGALCDSLPITSGSNTATTTINLSSTGTTAPDKSITVNLTVTGPSASPLTVSLSTINLTCTLSSGTYYPSAAQTVSVGSSGSTLFALNTAGSLPAAWVVLVAASPGGTATAGSPVTFTVRAGPLCNSLPITPGSNTATTFINLSSTAIPALDKQITVNLTVSGPTASPLVVNPSPITVTCAVSGGVYTPNYAQTVSVTSAAAGGTAFTIGTAAPSWLTIGTPSGGTASSSAVTFTLQAKSNCNGGVGTTLSIHLVNAPALDKQFAVTLQIVTPTVLAALPSPASFTYVKGSGTAGFVDVNITSSITSPYFSVNSSTLPSWLRTDTASGNAPQSLRFSSTNVADTLAPGTYPANVVVSVSGYGDLTIPISMLLTNKTAQMTIQGSTIVPLTWIIGQGLPTPTITAISTDTPIAYTATTGGSLGPVIAAGQQSGLAYSFGTPINVSFSPQVFAGAQPGNILTGTVTLTWGNPVSTIVVTFNITVLSPGATITSLSPATEANGQSTFTVALVGTGFVPSTDVTQKTRVGIVTTPGAAMTFDPAISVSITNQSNITLQFTYPGAGYTGTIPFTVPGTVLIGVCNPVGGAPCNIATASQTLNFGTSPIIQAITSSSSLIQNGTASFATYDMISIFGANFCPNCTSSGSGSILTGSPDAVTLTYGTSLTFTPTTAQALAGVPAGDLTVTFQPHSGSDFSATNAPILFATDGQINLMVPSAVLIGTPTDITVSYGPSGSAQTSGAFPVTIAATDPGIFTIGADGQGSGAALDLNYNLIGVTNPAGIRAVAVTGHSDVISIYMTGLGIPDSLGDNTTTGSFGYSADCVTPDSYLTSFNSAQTGTALGSLDGTLIIPSVLNTGRLVPCIRTGGTDVVTAKIGNQTAVVQYAGWVPGTIAGLYQVNLLLPDNIPSGFTTSAGGLLQTIAAPIQVPVTITSNALNTQAGVSIWVAPRLLMTGPSTSGGTVPNTLSATVGTPMPGSYAAANAVNATGNAGNVTYAITSGLLPSGLSIIPSGVNAGQIIGTPAANTGTAGSNAYTVTVTATDSSTIPVTGTNTFVVTVGSGLFLTNSTPTVSTFGTANNGGTGVTQVTASGGIAPYVYTMAISGFSLPTGLAINPATGIITTSALTPAGSYLLVVSVHDSTAVTPITGSSTFTVVVNLHEIAAATVTVFTAGTTSGAANTMTTTGNAGSLSYALDAGTQALVDGGQLTFDTSTGIVSVIGATSVVTSRTVTITATDGTPPANTSAAGTASASFTLSIVP